jgi:hypothetical protein
VSQVAAFPQALRTRFNFLDAFKLSNLLLYGDLACKSAANRESRYNMSQLISALQFSGHQFLRHRLVLSILSGKPVKIDKIRPEDKNPGLRGKNQETWLFDTYSDGLC